MKAEATSTPLRVPRAPRPVRGRTTLRPGTPLAAATHGHGHATGLLIRVATAAPASVCAATVRLGPWSWTANRCITRNRRKGQPRSPASACPSKWTPPGAVGRFGANLSPAPQPSPPTATTTRTRARADSRLACGASLDATLAPSPPYPDPRAARFKLDGCRHDTPGFALRRRSECATGREIGGVCSDHILGFSGSVGVGIFPNDNQNSSTCAPSADGVYFDPCAGRGCVWGGGIGAVRFAVAPPAPARPRTHSCL